MTCDEKITEAQAALQQGNYELSEQLYKEILQAEPENVPALDGLGILLCQKGETEAGIALFEQALHLVRVREHSFRLSWEASILFHLGLSYRTLGLRQEALNVFTKSAKLAPPSRDLVLNLGQIYFELEQYPQAAEQFQRLTEIQPDDASAWLTLGFILSNLDKHDEAAEALRTAEMLDSDSPEVSYYLAESLRKAERYIESLPPYQKLLEVGADYPQAVHGYGKSLLALGKLADGWDAMEFRFLSSLGSWERHHLENWVPDRQKGRHPTAVAGASAIADWGTCSDSSAEYRTLPPGGRQPTFGDHVLAYSEEGIGAELMFASCLPDLINSVEHCVVECEASLHSLFRRSFPRADFVPLADDYVHPEGNPWGIHLDAQIAFGSLPRYFRREMDNFPLRKAYLAPDRDLVDKWHTRLASLGDAKKIGLLWSGMWTNETPKQTSLPLQELRGLMTRHHEGTWINLQHGSHQKALNQPRIFPEAFKYDLDAMAALLVALDLVITPPGYIAHLAGALGVRTWLLLPEGADWRHSIDVSQNRSVWHPSIKMYRQAKGETWQHFFANVGSDLEQFLTTHRPPEEMPATLALPQRRILAMPKAA